MTWKTQREVFEKSYDEVLSALKHQDEKLNRTLTALAFLTAAGVAIYAQLAVRLDGRVRFDETGPDATVVFFVVFLVSVLLALLIALSAIGPSSSLLPQMERQPTVKEWPSLIFWSRIRNDPDWENRVNRDPDWLEECLARNLHEGARMLSDRVAYKAARSRESGAFVQVSVLALVLLGIFSIESIRLGVRWWIAAVVLSVVLLLPLWDLVQMKHYRFHEGPAQGSYVLVIIIVALAVLLLGLAQSRDIHWWAAFYALGAILAMRLAYVNQRMVRACLWLAACAGVMITLLALVL